MTIKNENILSLSTKTVNLAVGSHKVKITAISGQNWPYVFTSWYRMEIERNGQIIIHLQVPSDQAKCFPLS